MNGRFVGIGKAESAPNRLIHRTLRISLAATRTIPYNTHEGRERLPIVILVRALISLRCYPPLCGCRPECKAPHSWVLQPVGPIPCDDGGQSQTRGAWFRSTMIEIHERVTYRRSSTRAVTLWFYKGIGCHGLCCFESQTTVRPRPPSTKIFEILKLKHATERLNTLTNGTAIQFCYLREESLCI